MLRTRYSIRFALQASLAGLTLWVALGATLLSAQQPPARKAPPSRTLSSTSPAAGAEQPQFKGIWEPVNFNQDLKLLAVFFVTREEGWVSGAAGTILHTTDGGKTWTAQLGGDPHSQGPELTRLFFLDRTHGWAQSWNQLFRTTDGETWEEIGGDVRGNVVFVSPLKGFRIPYGSSIYETSDGGAHWKEALKCHAQMTVDGLARDANCWLYALQFISPELGFGVGEPDVLVKTTDGGATWQISVPSLPSGNPSSHDVFFLDANTGFMNRGYKLFGTTDGGQNWHGIPVAMPVADGGAVGPLRFADPEVGWSCAGSSLAYTTDGGKHWFSRELRLPALVFGLSVPRRDTAYVVGDHGMIYRYRIVPASYTVAHAIEAPAMPGIDSPVFGEVATMNDVLAKLRAKLPAAVAGQGGNQTFSQVAGVNPTLTAAQASAQASGQSSGFQQDTATPSGSATGAAGIPNGGSGAVGAAVFPQDSGVGPIAGGYLDSCCGPLIQQLETTANSFATNVPSFSQRFRNLNLILEGLNLVNSIVNQANTLKQSVRTLRQAKNPQAAAAAFSTVQTQVNTISSSGGFVQDTTLPSQP